MRIALVNESFDELRGGAERCAAALARALEARGHAVARIAIEPGRGRIGGTLGLVRAARAARRSSDRVVSLTRAPGDVLVPQGGVYLAAFLASVAPRGRARPAAAALKLISPKQWAFFAAERAAARAGRGTRFVALSRLVRDDMAHLWRVDPARIEVIPNGADVERFAPPAPEARAAARARLGVAPGEILALLVSHNLVLRGIDALLRAIARLGHPWRLVVVGRDRATPRWERLAARLGARATFAGPAEDVRPFYAAADVLAHPTFYDPCSLVTLEALACGLPVVTTRQNGAAELFAGEEGAVLADPADAPALAAALARFADPGARARAAAAARATALRHPAAAALERLCAAVEEGGAGRSTAFSSRPRSGRPGA